MDNSDTFDSLNDAQSEAVRSTEGFVRVIAGAGSGKTRALAFRFAWLVNEIGIMPGNILCVTFTNKSASEMRQRIHRLIGDNDAGYISTFHGFCVSVLQEDSNAIQYPKRFLVLDNSDIDDMLSIIYEERRLSLRDMTYATARDKIEIRKTKTIPDYYIDMITMSPDALKLKYDQAESPEDIIFYGYLYQEKKCFGLDYNDLIKFSLYIFENSPEIRLKWQQRLEYIMIDEFQDIDDLQYRLMTVLCDYHKNLFIVGDPDQTIYTWRGADVRFLLDFDKKFPDVKTIMMMQNYRSTPQILNVANSLIDSNSLRIKKSLIPVLSDGPLVSCHHDKTSSGEAAWIASQIKALVSDNVRFRDITLLYRSHFLSRILEEVFIREHIPYRISCGRQFFDRAEIKNAIAYLRMILYKDDLSFSRIVNIPKRNIGSQRIQFLRTYAEQYKCSLYNALKSSAETDLFKSTGASAFIALIEPFSAECVHLSISEVFAKILDKSGYEKLLRTEGAQERLDNLAELKQSIFDYETNCGEEANLEQYLSHVALFSDRDVSCEKDKVSLMTVHSAKGLEFPYVFLCALNEGIFPSKKAFSRLAMEEERRLAFVAMTRAEKALFLSDSEGENYDGSFRHQSRFIWEIDPKYLNFCPQNTDAQIDAAKKYAKLNSRFCDNTHEPFQAASKISHPICGNGVVLEVDESHSTYLIQFEGMTTPRKISFRAKMTKL